MEARQIFDDNTTDYVHRINNRMGTFGRSTVALLQSFVDDGDTETVAKQKVTDLNDEIAALGTDVIVSYWTGNTQPLVDAVNASILAHMTAPKKLIVTDILDRV